MVRRHLVYLVGVSLENADMNERKTFFLSLQEGLNQLKIMRNPSNITIPQSRQITNQINRLVDLNQLQMHPHNLIDSPSPRDESVEAKWEQIQYYEAKENHSLSSIASTNSNSTSSTSSNAKLKSR